MVYETFGAGISAAFRECRRAGGEQSRSNGATAHVTLCSQMCTDQTGTVEGPPGVDRGLKLRNRALACRHDVTLTHRAQTLTSW